MALFAFAIQLMQLLLQLRSVSIVEQFSTSAIQQLMAHVDARIISCGIIPVYHVTAPRLM